MTSVRTIIWDMKTISQKYRKLLTKNKNGLGCRNHVLNWSCKYIFLRANIFKCEIENLTWPRYERCYGVSNINYKVRLKSPKVGSVNVPCTSQRQLIRLFSIRVLLMSQISTLDPIQNGPYRVAHGWVGAKRSHSLSHIFYNDEHW